jgi:hypothetical protein
MPSTMSDLSAPPDNQASTAITQPRQVRAEELNALDITSVARMRDAAVKTLDRAGPDSLGTYPDRQPSSSVAPSVSGTHTIA